MRTGSGGESRKDQHSEGKYTTSYSRLEEWGNKAKCLWGEEKGNFVARQNDVELTWQINEK